MGRTLGLILKVVKDREVQRERTAYAKTCLQQLSPPRGPFRGIKEWSLFSEVVVSDPFSS